MLNIPHDPRVLAPLCRRHGIAAVSATRALLEEPRRKPPPFSGKTALPSA